MMNPSTFTIGDRTFNRLGYGGMRLTGEGVWGLPKDPANAISVLKRAVELGANFIDTADAYGPATNEEQIAEALHPYDGLFIATKGGLVRPAPGQWEPLGRPEYLRQCVEMSLRRLKVDVIDLWQLHRIDPQVPMADQIGLMADMQKEGKIAHLGLSQVSVGELKQAREIAPIVSVQNLYNLADRSSEDVLDYCTAEGIAFIPWFPVANGELARPGGVLDTMAHQTGYTVAQLALAWLLHKSPVMVPIPGTSSLAHLEENLQSASLSLSDDDLAKLEALASAETVGR
jgi:aryl-alcohol dehydrogenase-like predicted oxidoreductase